MPPINKQYRWRGPTDADLAKYVGAFATVLTAAPGPIEIIHIDPDTAENIQVVTEFMATRGFEPV